jgi:hypothetical protein
MNNILFHRAGGIPSSNAPHRWLITTNYIKFDRVLVISIVLLILYIMVVVFHILPTYYNISMIPLNMESNTCSSGLHHISTASQYSPAEVNSWCYSSLPLDSDNIITRFFNLFNKNNKFNCAVEEGLKNTFCKNKFISDKLVFYGIVGEEIDTNLLSISNINLLLESNKLLFFIDCYLYKMEELFILKGIMKP